MSSLIARSSFTSDQEDALWEHYSSKPSANSVRKLITFFEATYPTKKVPNRTTFSRFLKRKQNEMLGLNDLTIKASTRRLQAKFYVSSSFIILPLTKRAKCIILKDIEECVHLWMQECEKCNLPINWRTIKIAACDYAEKLGYPPGTFRASNGWQDRFRKRYSLGHIRLHGESASTSLTALQNELPLVIAKVRQYRPQDVYNMDETALLFCNPPVTTIGSKRIPGMKQDKSRMTVALTVNADGSDFREPLFIGNSLHPTCFGKKLTGKEDVFPRPPSL